jgi:hypothetical protein
MDNAFSTCKVGEALRGIAGWDHLVVHGAAGDLPAGRFEPRDLQSTGGRGSANLVGGLWSKEGNNTRVVLESVAKPRA